jgi:hypothetical protein
MIRERLKINPINKIPESGLEERYHLYLNIDLKGVWVNDHND